MAYIDQSNARRAMTLLAFAAYSLWLELRLDWAVLRFRHSRSRWQRLRAFNALRDLIYLRDQAQSAREYHFSVLRVERLAQWRIF